MEQVENIPVVVPPQNEVKAIHKELTVIKTKYLNLTEEAEKMISLMKEHRSALIFSAVTGKVEINNLKTKENYGNKTN